MTGVTLLFIWVNLQVIQSLDVRPSKARSSYHISLPSISFLWGMRCNHRTRIPWGESGSCHLPFPSIFFIIFLHFFLCSWSSSCSEFGSFHLPFPSILFIYLFCTLSYVFIKPSPFYFKQLPHALKDNLWKVHLFLIFFFNVEISHGLLLTTKNRRQNKLFS